MAPSRIAGMLSLVIVLTGCAATEAPSAKPSSAPSPTTPPSAASTPSVPPSAAPTPQPSVPPPAQPTAPIGENRDAIAEVLVDGGVRVRSLPTVADVSVRYEPLLRRGDEVFVVGGPVAGDGYDWYLVQSLIEGERGPFGWVSFSSRDGEPWIKDRTQTTCPSRSRDAWLGTILDEVLIHCFGGSDIEFEIDAGVSCFPDDPRLIDHQWLGPNCDMLHGDACGTCGLRIAAHPDAGFEIPAQDAARWAVRGHFDDPAAAECTPGPDADPAKIEQTAIHACRTTFVLTSLERLGDAAS